MGESFPDALARNYLPLGSNPDEVHEACEYFYTHIGAVEKDHHEPQYKCAISNEVPERRTKDGDALRKSAGEPSAVYRRR